MTLILGLTKEERAARRLGIGGSDAGDIMSGKWHRLWQIKTGRIEDEDLSDNLSVMMGNITEPLNLYLFERATGFAVSARREVRVHPYFSFMRVTLDGMTDHPATVQAKWTNPWSKIAELEQKYMAQCHHEMIVCNCDLAFLPILTGAPSYEIVKIERDKDYATKLRDREEEFWFYVESDRPPPDAPSIDGPLRPSTYRTVDMSQSNLWAVWADKFCRTLPAAKENRMAAKELRALVEADVGEAFGRGVTIKRSKDDKLLINGDSNGR